MTPAERMQRAIPAVFEASRELDKAARAMLLVDDYSLLCTDEVEIANANLRDRLRSIVADGQQCPRCGESGECPCPPSKSRYAVGRDFSLIMPDLLGEALRELALIEYIPAEESDLRPPRQRSRDRRDLIARIAALMPPTEVRHA